MAARSSSTRQAIRAHAVPVDSPHWDAPASLRETQDDILCDCTGGTRRLHGGCDNRRVDELPLPSCGAYKAGLILNVSSSAQ
jgi:hypothetical protein